jgi:hypothetical protein
VGKLVAAFIMFLAASALAIHESKPPPPPREDPIASRPVADEIDHTPPSRVVRDEVPPWVKYATPKATPAPPPPPPPPQMRVVHIEPSRVFTFDSDSSDDVPDAIDRCPDQPNDRDSEDGCPEVDGRLASRIILVE